MLSRFGQEVFLRNMTIGEATILAGLAEPGESYDPRRDEYESSALDTEYADPFDWYGCDGEEGEPDWPDDFWGERDVNDEPYPS